MSLLVLLSLVPLAASQLSSSLGPVVSVGYAAFLGNDTAPSGQPHSSVSFFGNIPYARPPLGGLRFRAPHPLDESPKHPSRIQISDARNWGPPCIQQPAQVGIGSEDCLTLNIWKPSTATEASSLPVVVYIHGGGLFAGSPLGFPLSDWVSQNQRIVGVSIAYRLNLLGFLGGSTLAADGDLNNGLRDQRAALEWVQRNIHRFGGDPNRVTIAGESAGAASVIMQIVAFAGKKPVPFKRAIAQSIGFGTTPSLEAANAIFKNVTDLVGCPPTGKASMACLRQASLGSIISAINIATYQPVIEPPSRNAFLPSLPSHLISSNQFNPTQFIGGHCTNDGRTFVGGTPSQFNSDDDIRERTLKGRYPLLTEDTIQKALALYPSPDLPNSPFKTQYERASQMAQDIVFSCMDLLLANKLTNQNVNDVFAFRWNSPHAVLFQETPFEGVMHTSDLYFLFDGTERLPNALNSFKAFNASESTLSKESIAYWTSFIASGDPNFNSPLSQPQPQPRRITWPPFTTPSQSKLPNNNTTTTTTNTQPRIVLTRGPNAQPNTTNTLVEAIPQEEFERCQFWMSRDVTAQTGV